MAKFSGVIGVLVGYEETESSVYEQKIERLKIAGDILSNNYRNDSNNRINEDVTVSNRFSFICPPKLITLLADNSQNSNAITALYIEYLGIKFKVTDFNFQMPRMIVSVGGLWHE